MKYFFSIYFLCLPFLLFSQNFSERHKTDSILNTYKINNQLDSLAKYAHKAALDFYFKQDYDSAIYFELKVIKLGKDIIGKKKKKHKQVIYNLARFYYLNDELEKSNAVFQRVINEFDIDAKTYQSYCDIGRNYSELYDFHTAVFYYKKGLEKPDILKPYTLCGKYIGFADAYNNIETKESTKQELIQLKKADSLFSKYNLNNLFYELNNQFALYYHNDLSFDFNKSRNYYKKILSKASKEQNHYIKTNTYNNLGELYNRIENDSAFYFLDKSIKDPNAYKPLLPNLYSNLAMHYSIKKEYEKALLNLHKSIQYLTLKQVDSSYLNTPSINDISLSKDKYLVLDNLKDKADNFLKLSVFSKDKEYLIIALKNLQLADKLLDVIKAENLEVKSKLFWQEKASELYMLATKACYLLNKPEDAFYYIEKNKALLLLDNISENKINIKSTLPLEIHQQEQDLKIEIFKIENKLNANYSKDLEDKYHSLKIDYNNFIESLKLDYTEYYNSKKPIELTTIEAVKNKLDDKTSILEYILNKDESYLLVITKGKTQLIKINDAVKLNAEINDYLKLLSQPLNAKSDLENYNKTANLLFKKLIPVKDLNILKERLIIIPDYILQNLPFESLKHNNNYLIEGFEISYAYSLSFLDKNSKLKRNANQPFIGFAPDTFSYDNLQALPRSKTETNTISNNLNGKTLLDTEANKTNFFKEINNYKILHLSTHANANDSISPWIAFKNEKLYLNELYTTKNQAELVVLNACNSSLGKINKGEGVFSLARGFFYSGSNSVVSSLWNVNDKSNAEITTSFYTYLKEGKSKSNALRQAKLDYLNTHSLSEASPYYWSSLILIGNDSTIILKDNTLYYIALAVLLLLVLFFILKKRKN